MSRFPRKGPVCPRSVLAGLAMVAAVAAVSGLAGCRVFDSSPDAQRTRADRPMLDLADDRVVLDVFFVRAPLSGEDAHHEIWDDVDEQPLAADVRRLLGQHGLRAGVVGRQLPPSIETLLLAADGGVLADGDATDLAAVTRQQLYLRPGRRGEIVTSPNYERLTMMTLHDGDLIGKTYENAQGLFAVHCHPQPDGRVRVELLPELRHGDTRPRWTGEDGMFRLDTGRGSLAFERLTMSALLSPGQMLVVGCRQQPLRSLGRDFLTDSVTTSPVQKLLVVRLLRARYDDSVDLPERLPATIDGA